LKDIPTPQNSKTPHHSPLGLPGQDEERTDRWQHRFTENPSCAFNQVVSQRQGRLDALNLLGPQKPQLRTAFTKLLLAQNEVVISHG
jgi:hypothetical protein